VASFYFTKPDTWNGGFYELSLEFSDSTEEELRAATHTLWSFPALKGYYLDNNREPDEQEPMNMSPISVEGGSHLYGLAHLPNGVQVACGSCFVRPDEGRAWLNFYLPMGALGDAYPVGGYPFESDVKKAELWQRPLDNWLAEIGDYVFSLVPFQLGLIGFEVSGDVTFAEQYAKGKPQERYIGYLWPDQGNLEYFPKNK
jgi:hypothetical protein